MYSKQLPPIPPTTPSPVASPTTGRRFDSPRFSPPGPPSAIETVAFMELLVKAIPNVGIFTNTDTPEPLKSKITRPTFVTAAIPSPSGTSVAHPLPLSHVFEAPGTNGTSFMCLYIGRSDPALGNIKTQNTGEITLDVPRLQQYWKFAGRFFTCCAPHMLLRFPPPKIEFPGTADSDQDLAEQSKTFWEFQRSGTYLRLTPELRAALASGNTEPIADPANTDLADIVQRGLHVKSLVDSPLTPFDEGLDNFILLVFKLSRVEVVSYNLTRKVYEHTPLGWTILP